MAENVLQTRILLRYDTYTHWMNSNLILRQGEAAIAYFPQKKRLEDLSNTEPENTPPAVGIKIGDGIRYFRELPWVQAIAADVYNWAKAPFKPTYTAQEIQGLQNFIEEIGGGGSGSGSGSTTYQLIEGTDDNINKYFLRHTDENGNWVVDTSTAINLSPLVNLINWIGPVLISEYPNMTARVTEQIQVLLGRLDVTDTVRENFFVTAVQQENGSITVSRAQPTFQNISGYASVLQGGTGRTSLPDGQVLIGNDTGQILGRPIAEEIANNNYLVPNYLVKAYIDNKTAGLEGAMHFIGDATVEPIGSVNPQVSDYNFSQAQPGDVVLWEQKEYVWTGGSWRILGDESSYVLKGSVKDSDVDENANIAQSKIANLADSLNSKVDKIVGKGLSTNDYTDEDKFKLTNIEEEAQKNIIEHIYLNNIEQSPHTVNGQNKAVEINIKEFDDESRRKLGTIEEGANVNLIESISLNGVPQAINQTKGINLTIKEFSDEEKRKLATIEEGAQVNEISGITLNGVVQYPDQNKIVALTVKEFSDEDRRKFNTIQEGAQVNTIESIYLNNQQLYPDNNKRIDLSINEYPTADAQALAEAVAKLATIESGAQVNVITEIRVDGTRITPDGTVVNLTTDPHTEHINKIESIAVNGQVVQPDQDKLVNLQLAQITPEQAEKLAGIEAGAQVNKLERIKYDGITYIPNENKLIEITSDPHTEHINVIESIAVNGQTILPDNNKQVNLQLSQITPEQAEKLAGIEAGAQVNPVIYLNDSPLRMYDDDGAHRIDLSIRQYPVTDEEKLSTIATGAEVNTISVIKVNNEIIEPINKIVNITIDPHIEHENVIEAIYLNNTLQTPNANKAVYLTVDENQINSIYLNNVLQQPDANKAVYLSIDQQFIKSIYLNNTLQTIDENKAVHIAADINTIEEIYVNNVLQEPTNKRINLTLNETTLGLDFIKGAEIPDGNTKQSVPIINQKLQFARVAVTSNVSDLSQTANTYILINCGSSTDVID